MKLIILLVCIFLSSCANHRTMSAPANYMEQVNSAKLVMVLPPEGVNLKVKFNQPYAGTNTLEEVVGSFFTKSSNERRYRIAKQYQDRLRAAVPRDALEEILEQNIVDSLQVSSGLEISSVETLNLSVDEYKNRFKKASGRTGATIDLMKLYPIMSRMSEDAIILVDVRYSLTERLNLLELLADMFLVPSTKLGWTESLRHIEALRGDRLLSQSKLISPEVNALEGTISQLQERRDNDSSITDRKKWYRTETKAAYEAVQDKIESNIKLRLEKDKEAAEKRLRESTVAISETSKENLEDEVFRERSRINSLSNFYFSEKNELLLIKDDAELFLFEFSRTAGALAKLMGLAFEKQIQPQDFKKKSPKLTLALHSEDLSDRFTFKALQLDSNEGYDFYYKDPSYYKLPTLYLASPKPLPPLITWYEQPYSAKFLDTMSNVFEETDK